MSEQIIIEQLGNALSRLDESLKIAPKDSTLAVDATIQRFEFCFELFWKMLQKLLFSSEGIEIRSPKKALQEALALGWITNENAWLQMLDDRNLTSHTYHEDLAAEIYARISGYYKLMSEAYNKIIKSKK